MSVKEGGWFPRGLELYYSTSAFGKEILVLMQQTKAIAPLPKPTPAQVPASSLASPAPPEQGFPFRLNFPSYSICSQVTQSSPMRTESQETGCTG